MALRESVSCTWPCWLRTRPGTLQVADGHHWHAAGIDGVLLPPPWCTDNDPTDLAPIDADASADPGVSATESVRRTAQRCRSLKLTCLFELVLDRVARSAAPSTASPDWLRPEASDPAMDPRAPRAALLSRSVLESPPETFVARWHQRLSAWAEAGADGFVFHAPHRLAPGVWRTLFEALRRTHPHVPLIAWTPGVPGHALPALALASFDHTVSSLAWWDGRADWLGEEDARLRAVAPVLAYAGARQNRGWLMAAAVYAEGAILDAPLDHPQALARIAQWRRAHALDGAPTIVGGQDGGATVLTRRSRDGEPVVLGLAADGTARATPNRADLAALLPATMQPVELTTDPAQPHPDHPEDTPALLWRSGAHQPIIKRIDAAGARAASRSRLLSRIRVEDLSPAVDGGRWPVKRITHEPLRVEAKIFVDSHEALAADLCWRACDEPQWQRVRMTPTDNDRWQAQCQPERVGLHEYCVAAWIDEWASFRAYWQAKDPGTQDVRNSLQEAALWLRDVLRPRRRTPHPSANPSDAAQWAPVQQVLSLLQALDGQTPDDAQWQALLSITVADQLRDCGRRPFEHVSRSMPLWVDRRQARFASWYELFPRSQSMQAHQHGTLDDVIRRLPDIQAMGFDVLYLTPIHPIGQQNRKGRNNAVVAQPDDVGSPYAIGSAHGGHDAIDPQLGSLADFRRLVQAAQAHGLEVALDFAIQCAPDHPWLQQHPDWFSWRPDGTVRHAENPPKKYEDIVNVTFYDRSGQRRRKIGLWRALRDIVFFWMEQGVRLFRVDNPHTKPLPFWHWLIEEVHARDPGVLFLSEAFTQPAMMYQLAKIGFTQSYSYFTWRNEPWEVNAYLQELSQAPVVDFFRPNFFANTPDINPIYLQTRGRPGFLVRAALAATSAGLWGIYSGYELCENRALPGREEYADSEKYELRPRDWEAPGHIRDQIAQLNQIRRTNPALHGQRHYHPLDAWPDSVLAYLRHSCTGVNVVLVILNLAPERTVDAAVPLKGITGAHNLLTGQYDHWQDETAHVHLTPEAPYGVWRLPPHAALH